VDLFHLFRWLLGIVVTVYATVITVQHLWEWWVWLTRPEQGMERPFALLRRYVLVHGLRLRIRRFGGDLLVCLGLIVIFGLITYAHWIVYAMPDLAGTAP
jgi:hypothetical protein